MGRFCDKLGVRPFEEKEEDVTEPSKFWGYDDKLNNIDRTKI